MPPRPARSPPRSRPPLSEEEAPAQFHLSSAVHLIVRLIGIALASSFRVFSIGARVSAAQLLSLPEWVGERFTTVNKATLSMYGVRNAGDEKRIDEVWTSDRYYIQAGVKVDAGADANPLLSLVMGRYPLVRLLVRLLRSVFAIQTVSVWINGQGAAVTETHFDTDHNLILVLHGSCIFHTAPRGALAPGGPGCRENESTNTPYNSRCFTAHRMTAGMVALQPAHLWHYVESSPRCVKLAIFFK